MVSIRKHFRDWLGINNLEARVIEVQEDCDYLRADYMDHMQLHHTENTGGRAIEASGRAAYDPEQKGNVVVTEPKLLKVLRKDIV